MYRPVFGAFFASPLPLYRRLHLQVCSTQTVFPSHLTAWRDSIVLLRSEFFSISALYLQLHLIFMFCLTAHGRISSQNVDFWLRPLLVSVELSDHVRYISVCSFAINHFASDSIYASLSSYPVLFGYVALRVPSCSSESI